MTIAVLPEKTCEITAECVCGYFSKSNETIKHVLVLFAALSISKSKCPQCGGLSVLTFTVKVRA